MNRVILDITQDPSHGNEFRIDIRCAGYNGNPLSLEDIASNDELSHSWYWCETGCYIYPGWEARFIKAATMLGHDIALNPIDKFALLSQ